MDPEIRINVNAKVLVASKKDYLNKLIINGILRLLKLLFGKRHS